MGRILLLTDIILVATGLASGEWLTQTHYVQVAEIKVKTELEEKGG